MVTYKKRETSCAWIIGILIFILAMVITFSDVYGLNRFDYGPPGGGLVVEQSANNTQNMPPSVGADYCLPGLPNPYDGPAVPEPTTIVLLAVGCGALLAGKRK